jgi:hypothetical protein
MRRDFGHSQRASFSPGLHRRLDWRLSENRRTLGEREEDGKDSKKALCHGEPGDKSVWLLW